MKRPGKQPGTGARGRGGLLARYGDSPLHLLLVLCSFALAGYAGVRLLDGNVLGVVLWFVGAAVLHDLVLAPLYSLADRGLRAAAGRIRGARGRSGQRAAGAPGARGPRAGEHGSASPQGEGRELVNYVRVPAFISLVLLLVWYPLVFDRVGHYASYTGLEAGGFMGRWLLVTAAVFVLSALCLAVRALRSRRRRRAQGAAADG